MLRLRLQDLEAKIGSQFRGQGLRGSGRVLRGPWKALIGFDLRDAFLLQGSGGSGKIQLLGRNVEP